MFTFVEFNCEGASLDGSIFQININVIGTLFSILRQVVFYLSKRIVM